MLFAFPRGSGLWTSRQPTVALFLRRETLPKENMHEKALFAVIRALCHPAPPGVPSPPRDLDLLLPSPLLFLFFFPAMASAASPPISAMGDPKRCYHVLTSLFFCANITFFFRPKTRHRAVPPKGEVGAGPLHLQPPPLRLGGGWGGAQCSKSARHPSTPVGTTCTTISLVVGVATPVTPKRILWRIMGLYRRFCDCFCPTPQERPYRRTSFWSHFRTISLGRC